MKKCCFCARNGFIVNSKLLCLCFAFFFLLSRTYIQFIVETLSSFSYVADVIYGECPFSTFRGGRLFSFLFCLNVKQVSRAPRQLFLLPRMCLFLNTWDQISAMLVTNPYLCVRGSPALCSLQMGMPLLALFTLQPCAFFSNYSNGTRGERGTGGQDAI